LSVTFSLGEVVIHEQERYFLIQSFARQHFLASVKDKQFDVLEPARGKHVRLRVDEGSVSELHTWLAGTFLISVVPAVEKVLLNWTALKKAAPDNFESLLKTDTAINANTVERFIPA
jgi:hypothetical protein